MDLYQQITAALDGELHEQKGIDLPDRYADWIDTEKLGRVIGDLLIDLAGTGQLLAGIDRIAR